jgi:c-di-GMP-binding flagellar brake protein YcgR
MAAMAADRRRAERTEIAVECTLQRARGGPIRCETVDLGPGGMAVCSDRPLAADELVDFDLPAVHGRARVLREQAYHVYALRFEALPEGARAELARMVGR